MTTTSASAASSVASKPACSSSPAIRSESWTFIWQPNVSIRYLRAMFRGLSPFALRFRLPLRQHLTGRGPKAIGNRFPTEHPRELVHALTGVQARDRGSGAAALDPFLNLK